MVWLQTLMPSVEQTFVASAQGTVSERRTDGDALHVNMAATSLVGPHWCRGGRGEPSCAADVAGASPVALQMWRG